MYFDPVSTWLVVLIADGIAVLSEKSGDGTSYDKWHREEVERENKILNEILRREKVGYEEIAHLYYGKQYGAYGTGPEAVYQFKVKSMIDRLVKSVTFEKTPWEIVIEPDNQDFIIRLLEDCEKTCLLHEDEKVRERAIRYGEAAKEALKKKEEYLSELEKKRIQEEIEKKRDEEASGCLFVMRFWGILLLVIFIFWLLS